MSEFQIPAGVTPTVVLADCANCASPTPVEDLTEGLCTDCQGAAAQALAAALGSRDEAPFALPLEEAVPEDELAARRARRTEVRQAAAAEPHGWLEHAIEAARSECVRGRHGHEFTADTLLEALEGAQAPLPPEPASFRFVMEHAMQRGWCEDTGRSQPSRREERQGKPVRIYRSCL